ncbi:MAG: methyltransferase domain-containing protein [Acidimicrobiales bacterium]
MPSPSSASLRRALVAELERTGVIRSAAVKRAFLRVPRERFVPEIAAREGLARVYANEALMTRTPQSGLPTSSSSQPSIMAEMLEQLRLRPGLRVLEIGAGTGYNAALLSLLVGRGGSVTSVDVQWDLADKAAKALREGGYGVDVLVGDAQHGRFGDGPYDRIILTASTDHVPRAWFDQLVPGGLIEMPLRLGPPGPYQQLVVTFERAGDGLRSVAVVGGGFMNLRSAGDGGTGEERQPLVSVHEFIDGRYRVYANLVGPGVAALKPEARRRLAGLLVSTPRTRTFAAPGGAGNTVLALVALSEPRRGVVVGHYGPEKPGIGVAATDGRSLALLVPDRKPDRCRLLQYGRNGVGLLDGELARWRAAGRPALGDWSIAVTFGEERPRGGDCVLRRRDCWITVDFGCNGLHPVKPAARKT